MDGRDQVGYGRADSLQMSIGTKKRETVLIQQNLAPRVSKATGDSNSDPVSENIELKKKVILSV